MCEEFWLVQICVFCKQRLVAEDDHESPETQRHQTVLHPNNKPIQCDYAKRLKIHVPKYCLYYKRVDVRERVTLCEACSQPPVVDE